MRAWIGVVAVISAFALTACASEQAPPTACRCPKPVAYSDAMIKKITAALKALPPDNVLQEAMSDYENERYALRACARIPASPLTAPATSSGAGGAPGRR